MRLIRQYLIREIALHFVTVTGVLFAILVSSQLTKVLSQAAGNQFPPGVVATLLGLSSLRYLPELAPLGVFLATVLALGRLYHDSEMTAMQSCGLGMRRVCVPVLAVAGIVALLLAWLALAVAPRTATRIQEISVQAMRDARLAGLEAQRFRSLGRDTIYYAERIENGVLFNVFVQRRSGDKVEIAVAPRAEQRGIGQEQQAFVLYDGERYEGVPGQGEFRIARFDEFGIPLRLPSLEQGVLRPSAKPTLALMSSADLRDIAELHMRLAGPVMTLVLGLLAVPLSRLRPRQGRYANVGIALLACFLYLMAVRFGGTWIEQGRIPANAGLWWLHAAAFAVGLLLLLQQDPPLRWFRDKAR